MAMAAGEGMVCAVTGGASGIGLGIAMHMGKLGYSVCMIDMNEEQLSKSLTQLEEAGIKAMIQKMDVTKEADWESFMTAIMEFGGRLDVLVQAAGVVGQTNLLCEAVDPANFDFVMSVNVRGIFLGCRQVLPQMKEQKFGRIVNIASIAGKEGNAGMLAYSTSKAAVIGLTKVIGKEYAECEGITVNCIAPAVVRTPMVDAMPPAQDLVSSLVSGLLTIGDRFGGAIDGAAKNFMEAIENKEAPDAFVARMKKEGKYIAGIGHRVKSLRNPDMRVQILKEYANAKFPCTDTLKYALAVEQVTTQKKETLILNVDGCIGAIMVDMLCNCNLFEDRAEGKLFINIGSLNGLFVVGRSIGLVGHAIDQKRINANLYRHDTDDILYHDAL